MFSPAPGLLVHGLWEGGFRDAQAFWTFQPFFLHRVTLQTLAMNLNAKILNCPHSPLVFTLLLRPWGGGGGGGQEGESPG